MASISKVGRKFSIRFRFAGKNHRVTVNSQSKAESTRLVIENALMDIKLGRLSIPDKANVSQFIASGGKAIGSVVSLAKLIEDWKSERRVAETTRKTEEIHCKHLGNFFRNQSVNSLQIDKYVEKRCRRVSKSTVKKELITLASILKYARSQGTPVSEQSLAMCRLSQCESHRPFSDLSKSQDGRCVLLDSEEIRQLRKTVRRKGSELIADAVDFTAFTGVRRSELCRVRPSDVQLENRLVIITEKKRKHGIITYRTIPIHDQLIPVLERRLTNEKRVVFTDSVNTLSSGLRKATSGTLFQRKGFGFHVLRHSVASQLLARGVPPVTVAALLGHASVSTTLKIYAHAFENETRMAVDKL